ncbi:MAG: DnaJ domain-containing protein [Bacteroidia bacterium]
MRNLYHILHLTPSCTSTDVKRAFRKLAHKYHPDHNASAEAAQLFNQIMEAYTILSNDALRTKYDALLTTKTIPVANAIKTDVHYKKYGTIGKFKNANPNYVVPARNYPNWARLERTGFYFMLGISIYGVGYSFMRMNSANNKTEFDAALNSLVGALFFAGLFLYCWFYIMSLNKKNK